MMPEQFPVRRAARGKVFLHLATGEPVGRPLSEWGYRTPRFPQGIKSSDLSSSLPGVQRETMTVWFLGNYVPAVGPYFGFDQAAPQSTSTLGNFFLDRTPLDVGVGGFDQAPFFSGGQSADLLKAEFKDIVRDDVLMQIAVIFEGLWEPIPDEPVVNLEAQTSSERTTSIVEALDELAAVVAKLMPEHGGIGHNMPPADIPAITEEEKVVVLRATAETRLAVLSGDYSSASAAWEVILPIAKRVGEAIARQIDNGFTKFTGTVGIAAGLILAGYVGNALGFWSKAEAINLMLEFAKHLVP
jgi:hypothetical protein